MRRRQALQSVTASLAAALTAGLAGCSQLTPSFGCGEGTTLRLRRATPDDVARRSASDLDSMLAFDRRIAEEAIADGESTYDAVSRQFRRSIEFVSSEGVFYRLTHTAGNPVTTSGTVYRIVRNESVDDEATASQTVPFAELSDADQKTLLTQLGSIKRLKVGAEFDHEFVAAYPDESTREASLLVPEFDGEFVEVEGVPVRLVFVETREVPVTTYTVTAEQVAESPSAFMDVVLGEGDYPTLDNLSAEQRDIIETAIEEEYDECAPYSEAYEDLLNRLGGSDWRVQRAPYATYEGEWYTVDANSFIA
jgi:hypothetical protein